MTIWRDVLGWGDIQLNELRFIGYIYLKEGQFEMARRFFEGLVLVEPDSAYDWRTLGAVYILLNNFPKAIEVLTKALQMEPGHAGAQLNLAKAYLYNGEREKGLEDVKKLTGNPDVPIANDAEALLLAYS
jgi:tetratricopeptide (TPR) repeat protein